MDNPVDLAGKTALVTGAGRGIGRACALALANAGAHVIAVARTGEDLEQLADDIPGDHVESWTEDVRDSGLAARIEELESLDILVNNAGTNRPEPFVDATEENLDLLLDLNVRSTFRTSQAAARVMLRGHSRGSIITITSQMGHVGAPNRTVYCMTKHALEGLTKAMAVELAPQGIRVNSIAPTFVETDLTQEMFANPDFKQSVIERIPARRLATVDDVAAAVLFLASPGASAIVGHSLRVDGGWTAQ